MTSRDLTPVFMEFRSAALAAATVRRRRQGNRYNNNGGGGLSTPLSGGHYRHHHYDLSLNEEGEEDVDAIELGTGGGGGFGQAGKLRHTGCSSSSGAAEVELATLSSASSSASTQPPTAAWIKHVQAVEHAMREIDTKLPQLHALHASRLGSVFGKDLSLARMETQIDQATHALTDFFRAAEQHLHNIGKCTKLQLQQRRNSNNNNNRNSSAAVGDVNIGLNAQKSLALQLQERSVKFRQLQRQYLREVQAQKKGGLVMFPPGDSSSNSTSDDTSSHSPFGGLLSDGGVGGGEFFHMNQQQLDMVVVDDMSTIIQSRDQEIIQIAQSIEELSSIFKELAVLVIDQGTILDRIDYNMEAVVESTQVGLQHLEKAERSQKNARPMRCIVCLSVTIFVLMLILILKHRPRHGW